jgi:hypothetical protein
MNDEQEHWPPTSNGEFEQDQRPPTKPKEVQEEEVKKMAHVPMELAMCMHQGQGVPNQSARLDKWDRIRRWAESKLVLRRTS